MRETARLLESYPMPTAHGYSRYWTLPIPRDSTSGVILPQLLNDFLTVPYSIAGLRLDWGSEVVV